MQLRTFKLTVGAGDFRSCFANVSRPDAEEIGRAIEFAVWANRSSAFWLGDLVQAAMDLYGDDFWQHIDLPPGIFDHLERCRAISNKVPKENRNMDVSWTHHCYAACLPFNMQQWAIGNAVENGLNSAEFLTFVSNLKKTLSLEASSRGS